VAWLEALIDELNEPRIDIVASSLGGLWAAGFFTRCPSRVRRAALIGAIGLQSLSDERRRWTADNLSRMDRVSIAERFRRAVLDPGCVPEEFIEEAFRMNNSTGAREAFVAIAHYYLERINDDLQLEALQNRMPQRPLLLIWGREDATVPYAATREAAAVIPDCALLSLDHTRHVPQLERPAAVRWALSRHFGGERFAKGPTEHGEVS